MFLLICNSSLFNYLYYLLAEPDVLKEVKQKLDLGSVKFEVFYSSSSTHVDVVSIHVLSSPNLRIKLFCYRPSATRTVLLNGYIVVQPFLPRFSIIKKHIAIVSLCHLFSYIAGPWSG